MLKGLRWKIVVTQMLIVALMLCVIFALVYHVTRENLERESRQTLQRLAGDPYPLGIPGWGGAGDEVNLPYFILQIGLTGEVVATSGGYYDLSDEAWLGRILQAVLNDGREQGELPDYHLRYLRQPGLLSQSIVFVDTSSEEKTLENLLMLSVFVALAALVAFLPLSLLFARWAVRPVEKAWSQQKQFVADASHELKTPLTVILTNAELLQDPDCRPEQREGFARSILTMSRQMRDLVEGLLELARADRGRETAALAELDLSALTARTLLPFEAVFFERELSLESEIRPGLRLRGEEEKLRQLLEILLDNARKYASAPGWVRVTLKKQGKQALLTVENSGEALSPAQCRDIFKRFYRLDGVRGREGGYGLGLSIGENIAKAHGGRLWAESEEGVNRFCASFPL